MIHSRKPPGLYPISTRGPLSSFFSREREREHNELNDGLLATRQVGRGGWEKRRSKASSTTSLGCQEVNGGGGSVSAVDGDERRRRLELLSRARAPKKHARCLEKLEEDDCGRGLDGGE